MKRKAQYELYGRTVNAPHALKRVPDGLPAPTSCRFCNGDVELVSNAVFYGGREYGWPLAYRCAGCGARVGCHPDTDIPLGTLADKLTMEARKRAHAVFDPHWKESGPGARKRAYRALSAIIGVPAAHISWLDADQCAQVVACCLDGRLESWLRDESELLKAAEGLKAAAA